MSIVQSVKRLLRRAYPGFPEFYAPRIGTVVAIADPTDAETATDRFRPRYAADVQLLTPQGEPDASMPVLKGLPLPASPVFHFPEIGTRVRVGFDYGLASFPHIQQVLAEGSPMPALRPGEWVLPLGDGVELRADRRGDVTLQTDGKLILDAHELELLTDLLTETVGARDSTVDGDRSEITGGRLLETILGGHTRQVAGDVREAVIGSEDRTIGGDKGELIGGKSELAVQQALTLKANLGDVLIEAVTGSAEFKSAVKNSITSALVDIGVSPTDAMVLGNAFKTLFNAHTHPGVSTGGSSTGPAQLAGVNNPFDLVPGTHLSLTNKTK